MRTHVRHLSSIKASCALARCAALLLHYIPNQRTNEPTPALLIYYSSQKPIAFYFRHCAPSPFSLPLRVKVASGRYRPPSALSPTSPSTRRMSRLLRLPEEVKVVILGYLGNEDLATLSYTHPSFTDIIGPYLRRRPNAICWAVRNGKLTILRKALQKPGVDLDSLEPDVDGGTALYYTTKCYNESVVESIQLLLEAGADIDSSGWEETPLELACCYQNFRVAMVLLKAGASIPHYLLLDCVSSIKAKSAKAFVTDRLVDKLVQFQRDVISEIGVKHGEYIDRSPKGEDAETALMRATREGEPSTVELLLKLGANVNARGGSRMTALMVAVWEEKLQMVEILLAADAAVNLTDVDGQTANWYLPPAEVNLGQDSERIWTLLLKAGSDIMARSWSPDHGHGSLFDFAVYEAWRGRQLSLDLIKKHSTINYALELEKANRFLQSTTYSSKSTFEDMRRALYPKEDEEDEFTGVWLFIHLLQNYDLVRYSLPL